MREAVEEYGQETAEQEQPLDHFIEWLVEWCRTVRHRQTGLLLLSAHRAKGLEFEHVAVLDGEWQQLSRGEDPDAPRRLYSVAMTRARQSLVLARMHGGVHRLAILLGGIDQDIHAFGRSGLRMKGHGVTTDDQVPNLVSVECGQEFFEVWVHPAVAPAAAGWKRERMPRIPNDQRFDVIPNWVCDVLSSSTASRDRELKMPLYASYGVQHAWLIDPTARILEAYELRTGSWTPVATFREGSENLCSAVRGAFAGIAVELSTTRKRRCVGLREIRIKRYLDLSIESQYVICVKNAGYSASLQLRKLYRRIPDQDAERHGQLRIVDESGEDYLYLEEYFVSVQLPAEADRYLSGSA